MTRVQFLGDSLKCLRDFPVNAVRDDYLLDGV
jgi:hypothetical protein